MEDVFDPLEELENFTGPDLSFAEYLDLEELYRKTDRVEIAYSHDMTTAAR